MMLLLTLGKGIKHLGHQRLNFCTFKAIDNITKQQFYNVAATISKMTSSRKILTLAMVRSENNILLGLKKKGFGEGKWNGFGGKVEQGETICEGAIRELHEECGLVAKELTKIGIIEFEFVNDPVLLEVHVYDITRYEGELRESEEMLPKWFSIDNIPYNKMWADDEIWYPRYLNGERFKAYFLYEGPDTILQFKLEQVEHLPL